MKKLLILLLAMFALLPACAYAAVKISPTLIELDANKAKNNCLTTSFDVQAKKDEIIKFKVYPESFKIASDGRMQVLDESGGENPLAKNMHFTPDEFTLTNGQKQTVKLTFNDLNQLPDGESRVVLFLEDVLLKEVSTTSPHGVISKHVVKSRVGVPVYIDKGNYIRLVQFDDLKVENADDNLVYKIKLSSLGNSKIVYSGKGQIIKDKNLIKEFPIPSNAVGANGIFDCAFNMPMSAVKEEGDYTLRLILQYKNEKNETKRLIKEVQFTREIPSI